MSLPLMLAIGCANPGPPRPPSLNLPQPVRNFSAERVADGLQMVWTTPRLTTDKTVIQGAIKAVVCEQAGVNQTGSKGQQEEARGGTGASSGSSSRVGGAACRPLATSQVQPGTTHLEVTLPPDLSSGPVRPLRLRVELVNSRGRSAGESRVFFTLAGIAPASAGAIRATPQRGGVLVTWKAEPADLRNGHMELVRQTLAPAPGAAPASGNLQSQRQVRLGAAVSGSARDSTVHLAAPLAASDPGGMLDGSVASGATYRYVAQRVRTATLGGQTLRLRGEPSAPALITYRATFPPDAPAGLQAISTGSLSDRAPSIDLSWEPSAQQDVSGYNIYRSDAGKATFVRLNPTPVMAPAYRDASVVEGRRYRYQVTAVDSHRNESAPGNDVEVGVEQK